MSFLSATVPIILPMARFRIFSVAGASAARVVFEVGDRSLSVLATTMRP
jgi:hypothetical protein